jgi:hypothetical protein
MFRLLRFGDQLVNGLAREELVRQGVTLPGMLESVPSNSNRKHGARASQRLFTTEARRAERKSLLIIKAVLPG